MKGGTAALMLLDALLLRDAHRDAVLAHLERYNVRSSPRPRLTFR